MDPTQELIDDIYREKVLRARRMTPSARIMAGPRLFDYACKMTLAGIRHQYPGTDDRRALEILRERIAKVKRMDRRA
jgi:hypothetical protein